MPRVGILLKILPLLLFVQISVQTNSVRADNFAAKVWAAVYHVIQSRPRDPNIPMNGVRETGKEQAKIILDSYLEAGLFESEAQMEDELDRVAFDSAMMRDIQDWEAVSKAELSAVVIITGARVLDRMRHRQSRLLGWWSQPREALHVRLLRLYRIRQDHYFEEFEFTTGQTGENVEEFFASVLSTECYRLFSKNMNVYSAEISKILRPKRRW